MKEHTKVILVTLLSALALFSCQVNKGAKKENSDTAKTAITQEKFQLTFFEAQKEKSIENYEKSYEQFQTCLEFDDQEDAVYYELAKLDTLNGNFGSGLDHIKKAISLAPNNLWYARLKADMEVETGDLSSGILTLKSIAARDPDDVNYRDKLASLSIYNEDYKTALKAYNEIESILGINEDLTREKYVIYKSLGDADSGLNELIKLSDFSPNNLTYLRNIAAHYNETGQPDKCLEVFEKIIRIDPEDGNTQLALAEIYSAQGKTEQSNKALEKGFSDPNSSANTKLQVLVSIIGSKDVKVNTDLLISTLQSAHPTNADVWKISGDLADAKGLITGAISHYKKALKIEPNNLNLWLTVINKEAKAGEFENLKKTGKDAQLLFPLQPEFYLYEGIALAKLGEADKAISSLETGKSFVLNNDLLKAKFNSQLGNTYHSVGNFQKSDNVFQKALAENDKDPFIKNDYAYCLAERRQSTEHAKSLINIAIALLINHPTLEDTYAFLLFQNEELKMAQKWIKQSLNHGGDKTGSTLELAGDIHAKLGEMEEAKDYWKKAQALGGTSNLIEIKIADERYISK